MDRLQTLEDYQAVQDTVNRIFVYTDERNWAEVIRCFADEVLLDYTSMTGGEPIRLTPQIIVESWQAILPGFKFTQHTISNHQIIVHNDEADCFSYGTAVHYLPNASGQDTWTVVGTYNHHLIRTGRGWRVDQMRFNLRFIQGNPDLPRLAQEAIQSK